jgi:hypothetical protein
MAMVSRVGVLGLDDAAQRPDGSGDVVGCDVRAVNDDKALPAGDAAGSGCVTAVSGALPMG